MTLSQYNVSIFNSVLWYREFIEYSEAGQQRSIIFERIENISNSNFLDEQKRSIQLSLDLKNKFSR